VGTNWWSSVARRVKASRPLRYDGTDARRAGPALRMQEETGCRLSS
jgi:hypothetical protein